MDRSVRLIGALYILLATGTAFADGWSLQDGRFPGETSIVDLSPEQITRLDYIRKCRGDNARTPYVFHLTPEQSGSLKAATGTSATRFAIYDSTRGDVAVDLPANALVRFATRQAEIPLQLVLADSELLRYERETMGWGQNPVELATPSQVASGKCPD